jgi:hypothetical protein
MGCKLLRCMFQSVVYRVCHSFIEHVKSTALQAILTYALPVAVLCTVGSEICWLRPYALYGQGGL